MEFEKYIQTNFAKGFELGNSDRFGQRIWTSLFRPIWSTDLNKYIQTDFAIGFEQVYSDRFGQRFGQVYSDRFG